MPEPRSERRPAIRSKNNGSVGVLPSSGTCPARPGECRPISERTGARLAVAKAQVGRLGRCRVAASGIMRVSPDQRRPGLSLREIVRFAKAFCVPTAEGETQLHPSTGRQPPFRIGRLEPTDRHPEVVTAARRGAADEARLGLTIHGCPAPAAASCTRAHMRCLQARSNEDGDDKLRGGVARDRS